MTESTTEAASKSENSTQKLQTIFDEYWEFRLEEDPILGTSFGASHLNDRLPDTSPEAYDRRYKKRKEFLDRLDEISTDDIAPDYQRNQKILRQILEWSIREYELGTRYLSFSQISGFHLAFPQLWLQIPLQNTEDYQNYLKRLSTIRKYVTDLKRLLNEGIEKKRTPPSTALEGVMDQLSQQIVDNPRKSDFYVPFQQLPDHIPSEQQEDLKERARKVISKNVLPAFEEFRSYFQDQYLPEAQEDISCKSLPNGPELYEFLVQKHTTRDLSPEEIHKIGQKEVNRLKTEMDRLIESLDFEGDFAEFQQFLRNDDRFYFDDPDDLLQEYRDICKQMDAELPRLFGILPRTTYGVREVPEHAADDAPTAYYMKPAGDGSRPGWFFANTTDLQSRPKYEMQALAFHEAVPGHHLQIALQQEQAGLVDFRKAVSFTAYVEGWGLYAERLGKEVGFYRNPYAEFGRLSYNMWRSLRLVVDTGIHHYNWSRSKAIDYMEKYSTLSGKNIENEVDRYIAWPGQALSYKIGEQTISQLRSYAEETLGPQFDVRSFHDHLLKTGPIPLDLLESRIKEWVDRRARS